MKSVLRRILLGAVVVVALLVLALVVALYLPPVQHWAFQRVTAIISRSTGMDIQARQVGFRPFPAHLSLQAVTARVEGQQVVSVGSLDAGWSWLQLVSQPRRIREVTVSDVEVDLRRLPGRSAGEAGGGVPQSLWTSFEIGSLNLVGGHMVAAPDDSVIEVRGLRADASLEAATAHLVATADAVAVRRHERELRFGDVRLRVAADASGLHIDSLEAEGPDGGFRLSGQTALGTVGTVDLDLAAHARLGPVLSWWDPSLGAELQPVGSVTLQGRVRRTSAGALEAHLEQVEPGFALAGYRVAALELDLADNRITVRVAGGNWGHATVTVAPGARVAVDAALQEAPRGAALAMALGRRADQVPGPVVASGTVEAHLGYPLRVEELTGEVDLHVSSPRAAFDVQASGAGRSWQVRRLVGTAPGGRIEAAGTIGDGMGVAVEADIAVEEPGRLVAFLDDWYPPLGQLAVAGGPLTGHVAAGGSLAAPRLDVDLHWQEPSVMGLGAASLAAGGHMEDGTLRWQADSELGGGAVARVEGTTDVHSLATDGRWLVAAPSLAELQQAQPLPRAVAVAGTGSGEGSFSWSPAGWQAQGSLTLADVDVAGWKAEEARASFSADAQGVQLVRLDVRALGGTVEGSGSVAFADHQSPIQVSLAWRGIDVQRLPLSMPQELSGSLAGSLDLRGEMAHPEGTLDVSWQGGRQVVLADHGQATLALENGVLRLTTDRVETVGGSFILQGSAPLGDLPLPEWLWPDAPGGPVRVSLRASGLRSSPLLDAVQIELPALKATLDRLDVDLWVDPSDPAARQGEVVATGVTLETSMETVRSTEPIRLEVDGSRVSLQPFTLEGPKTQLAMGGTYDLSSDTIDSRVEATLGPDLARLLPVPVRVLKPIKVSLDLSGPLTKPTGSVTVDHPGGEIVLRSPALKVSDLHLAATVENGVVSIDDGSATVNRGQVLFGGGWDPRVGQGVVLELEDVYFLLPMNIITSWNGQIALEPDPKRLVKIVGDVYLQAGVWDHPVSLTSMVLNAETPIAPPLDDPLREILLDLQVWGRGQVHVDNNLGDFNVTWNVLHVGGSAAEPLIRGVLRLSPGGTLNLPGQAVTIRRAEIDFTGTPGVAPNVEIVPQQNIAAYGGGGQGSSTFNAAELATQTVARGIGSALGLENETLQPAEIGVETETNATSNFTIGQRLGRNAALFFSSNLSNVQEQTTMLQLWNFHGLPGLALQGYTATQPKQDGANLIERFRWGGSKGAGEKATIQGIKLEGDWPISKRRLKKATGLKKGEPFEPFLLFAAGLAMERELAGAGYQYALVDGEARGSDTLPELVFTVQPGPRQVIHFKGAQPPRQVRRDVTSLYQPPPLENAAFDNMATTLRRYYASEEHTEAQVTVARQGEAVVATIHRGPRVQLEGPVIEGVPDEVQQTIRDLLSNQTELANLLHQPDVGKRFVERLLDNSGYPHAQVTRIWAEDEGRHTRRVHLDVEVGRRVTVSDITLVGEDPLEVLGEGSKIGLEPGMTLDRSQIELAASRIRSRYVEQGYTDAQVQIRQEQKAEDSYDLEVHLDPGTRRIITEIQIQGLRHISRSVIVKGLVVQQGEAYRPSELDQSVARIASFAPVESVQATTDPLGTDRTRVDVVVREKPRWTAEVGAGWNSDRGAEGRFGLRDDDLFGRGVGLNLRGRVSQDDRLLLLYGSLPPLPGGRISFLGNFTYFNGPTPGTDQNSRDRSYSVSVEGDYQIGARGTSARGYYQLRRTVTTVELVDLGLSFSNTVRQAILGGQIIQDELDNPFDPHHGYYAAIDLSWDTPPLGSDVADVKSVLTTSFAVEPWTNWTWTQALRLGWATGLKGQDLIQERAFFAGGQASIRGFDLDSVGPTRIGIGGEPVADGGGALFILNNELRIPVWGGLRIALFADVGQVWRTWGGAGVPLAVGSGIGVRWSTPVGPVWGDVAWPVADVGISSRGPKFYLGIGRPF